MKKRKVALVLAGGGARGVAHIGAIEELESQGFEISAVAGTSMGALVGGVYASGHLEPFKQWLCELDKYKVFSLVDFALSTEGLVKGNRVIGAMKELVPDVKIEQMPLPFAAVAADLLTGREVVLERGGQSLHFGLDRLLVLREQQPFVILRADIAVERAVAPHLLGGFFQIPRAGIGVGNAQQSFVMRPRQNSPRRGEFFGKEYIKLPVIV